MQDKVQPPDQGEPPVHAGMHRLPLLSPEWDGVPPGDLQQRSGGFRGRFPPITGRVAIVTYF
jgi:hypothetical protein